VASQGQCNDRRRRRNFRQNLGRATASAPASISSAAFAQRLGQQIGTDQRGMFKLRMHAGITYCKCGGDAGALPPWPCGHSPRDIFEQMKREKFRVCGMGKGWFDWVLVDLAIGY
jgi:hypothetical protein